MIKKIFATAAILTFSPVLSGAIAFADTVSNNVDASIDASVESLPLTVSGSNGTVILSVSATNGDGKNGCNLTGGKVLTVSITSNHPEFATVSPSSKTFTSCGDTATLTVTPVAEGEATVSLAQTANDTGAIFDLSTATFKAVVTPAAPVIVVDTTAPTLNLPSDMIVEATSAAGATVAYAASATDVSPASPAVSCTPASGATFPLGATIVNCSSTDAANNTANGSFTVTVQDTTAPGVPTPTSPADNTFTTTLNQTLIDWSDSTDAGDVSVPVSYVYEAANIPDVTGLGAFTTPIYTSGALTVSEIPTPGTPEGVYYWHARALDSVGNTSAWSETRKITVDNQAPTVICDPAVADGNWHQNDVSFPCTSADNGPAGLANEADASFSLSTDVAADTEDANASTVAHDDVCDLSGNCTPVAAITGNMIDKKGPTITATQDLVYTYNQAVTPVYSCTDAGSGMVGGSSSCSNTTVDTSSITLVSRTFTISAMDMVGNASTLPVSFTVLGYENFTLGNPLSMSLKDFKKASTIPVKFMIKNHDLTYVNNASAHLKVNGADAIASGSSNTGTLFRYDAAAHQYIYNLSTKSLHLGDNYLDIDLGDGSTPVHKTFIIK